MGRGMLSSVLCAAPHGRGFRCENLPGGSDKVRLCRSPGRIRSSGDITLVTSSCGVCAGVSVFDFGGTDGPDYYGKRFGYQHRPYLAVGPDLRAIVRQALSATFEADQ